jgi:hypothetical protein
MSSVLDLREVIRTFRSLSPIMAYEITGARQTDGTWNGPASTPRRIEAAVFPARLQDLEILTPGEASSGGLAISTQEHLHFQNAQNDGVENLQSFVTYENYTWRIIGTGLMMPLGNFHLYMALRYMAAGVEALTS